MTRLEVLHLERERILMRLSTVENRAKWLTMLMDIDDELEEMNETKRKARMREFQVEPRLSVLPSSRYLYG